MWHRKINFAILMHLFALDFSSGELYSTGENIYITLQSYIVRILYTTSWNFRIKRDSWSNKRASCLASQANFRHRSVSLATSGYTVVLRTIHSNTHNSYGLVICLDPTSSLLLIYGFAYILSKRPRI